MPEVVRKGDKNSAGGRTLTGDKSFIVDGRPICPVGTPVSPHKPCPEVKKHCNAKTSQGTKSFILNGIKVNVKGHVDTCGHSRAEGSKTFIVSSS